MKQIVKERPYYAISGLTVSEDGLTIKRQYKTTPGYPDYPKKLAIQMDKNGCLYIKADGKKHFVDVLVATCFCHKPDGANAVQHIDGLHPCGAAFPAVRQWSECGRSPVAEYSLCGLSLKVQR